MPAEFILAIICLVAAGIAWFVWRNMKHSTTTHSRTGVEGPTYTSGSVTGTKWSAISLGILGAFFMLLSSMQIVGTKEVGVVTSFGATDGHLHSGLGFTFPWENVTEIDGAIQTDEYSQAKGNAFTIRIANQQTAFPDVTIRWRINPVQADAVFQNYRTFDNVRDSLVTKALKQALAAQLENYNALNSVQEGTPAQGARNPTYQQLALNVLHDLKHRIGDQVEVKSIYMPFVGFDAQTQAKLNLLQEQIADTRRAIQLQQTNIALKKANNILASSVNKSPNVLVAQCMTYLGELVKGGGTIPPGFSCWPGSGVAGIIANTGK